MNKISGPGGPREPFKPQPGTPATHLPPSLRPQEPPPPAAIKVDSAQVTSRLHAYDVPDTPLLSGLRVAMVAALDPGMEGDAVRRGMASADPARLRAGLQVKRSDGKSAWDRMEPRVQELVAGDIKARAQAFKGFITDKRIGGLVDRMKNQPQGPEVKRFEQSLLQLTESDAQKAADAISAVDKNSAPEKEGARWAQLFHMFATGQALPVFI